MKVKKVFLIIAISALVTITSVYAQNDMEQKARATAEAMLDQQNSEQYTKEAKKLSETMRGSVLNSKAEGPFVKGPLASSERVYLFISSSLPKETLRRYVFALEKIKSPNTKVVMRGFIGGMKYVKPTLKFVREITQKDENCDPKESQCEMSSVGVDVDPFLFKRYGIDRVPAVVYAMNINIKDPEKSEGWSENSEIGKYYVVYGDANMESLLEMIHRKTKSKTIERMITKLRAGFYDGQ